LIYVKPQHNLSAAYDRWQIPYVAFGSFSIGNRLPLRSENEHHLLRATAVLESLQIDQSQGRDGRAVASYTQLVSRSTRSEPKPAA
jgi:hypothetical protein